MQDPGYPVLEQLAQFLMCSFWKLTLYQTTLQTSTTINKVIRDGGGSTKHQELFVARNYPEEQIMFPHLHIGV